MANYILVASEGSTTEGQLVTSEKVGRIRIQNRAWALYEHTPNRKTIAVNDRIVVYVTGSIKVGGFIASATVSAIAASPSELRSWSEAPLFVVSAASRILKLDNVLIFPQKVLIASVKSDLKFIPKTKKWGTALLGGCIKIDDEDFSKIVTQDD